MQKFKQIIVGTMLAVVLGFGFIPLLVTTVSATPKTDACTAINGNATCATPSGFTLDNTLKVVIEILSSIVGIIAVIMIVIAGIKYSSSGGDASSISSAKNTIIYALVGLVVAASAQFLARYVLFSIK